MHWASLLVARIRPAEQFSRTVLSQTLPGLLILRCRREFHLLVVDRSLVSCSSISSSTTTHGIISCCWLLLITHLCRSVQLIAETAEQYFMSCDIPAVNLGTNYAVLKPSSCVRARSDQSSTSSASIWCVISSQEELYSQSSKNCLLRSAAILWPWAALKTILLGYSIIWSGFHVQLAAASFKLSFLALTLQLPAALM